MLHTPPFHHDDIDHPAAVAVGRLYGQHHWGFIATFAIDQYRKIRSYELHGSSRPRRPVSVDSCCGSPSKVVVLGTQPGMVGLFDFQSQQLIFVAGGGSPGHFYSGSSIDSGDGRYARFGNMPRAVSAAANQLDGTYFAIVADTDNRVLRK